MYFLSPMVYSPLELYQGFQRFFFCNGLTLVFSITIWHFGLTYGVAVSTLGVLIFV